MKLYYAPKTRALRPRWMLEELGLSYELVRLDLSRGDHKSGEYRAIHPHGRVPALVEGKTTIIESAAICAYLADAHLDAKLAPPPQAPERASYLQWLFWSVAMLEPAIVDASFTRKHEDAEALARANETLDECARVIGRSLQGHEFLLGERFTTADVLVGSMLVWGRALGLFEGRPDLAAYTARLTSREAYKRARAD